MTFKLVAIAFIVALSLAQIKSCQTDERPEKQNEVREVFSHNSNVELLFFYKKESSRAERKSFFENILHQPHPGGGYWPRDGVKATFGIDLMGYEGFGIKFLDDVSEEQKREVKRLIETSPVVYRVYENVIPSEIKDL
jgi:hypothetical protein